MHKRTSIDHRLSIGFDENTLARINRLAWRFDPFFEYGAVDIRKPIAGSACDWRQQLLRMIIDEASRALEESADALPREDAGKMVKWFRFEIGSSQTPRAYEAEIADERAVRELLAEATL